MEDLERFVSIVKEVIQEYAAFKPSVGEVEVEAVFDDNSRHYELMYAGWNGFHRIHGSVIHVDIRDGKVWIQHDGTEGGIANDLIERGIPEKSIVLGFHHPHKRPHTPFAVG